MCFVPIMTPQSDTYHTSQATNRETTSVTNPVNNTPSTGLVNQLKVVGVLGALPFNKSLVYMVKDMNDRGHFLTASQISSEYYHLLVDWLLARMRYAKPVSGIHINPRIINIDGRTDTIERIVGLARHREGVIFLTKFKDQGIMESKFITEKQARDQIPRHLIDFFEKKFVEARQCSTAYADHPKVVPENYHYQLTK